MMPAHPHCSTPFPNPWPDEIRMRAYSSAWIVEGYPEDDGTIVYELDHIRVAIVEQVDAAHVVTVMRLRAHP